VRALCEPVPRRRGRLFRRVRGLVCADTTFSTVVGDGASLCSGNSSLSQRESSDGNPTRDGAGLVVAINFFFSS